MADRKEGHSWDHSVLWKNRPSRLQSIFWVSISDVWIFSKVFSKFFGGLYPGVIIFPTRTSCAMKKSLKFTMQHLHQVWSPKMGVLYNDPCISTACKHQVLWRQESFLWLVGFESPVGPQKSLESKGHGGDSAGHGGDSSPFPILSMGRTVYWDPCDYCISIGKCEGKYTSPMDFLGIWNFKGIHLLQKMECHADGKMNIWSSKLASIRWLGHLMSWEWHINYRVVKGGGFQGEGVP